MPILRNRRRIRTLEQDVRNLADAHHQTWGMVEDLLTDRQHLHLELANAHQANTDLRHNSQDFKTAPTEESIEGNRLDQIRSVLATLVAMTATLESRLDDISDRLRSIETNDVAGSPVAPPKHR